MTSVSTVRWKLWIEGKEFFVKPGSIKTSIRGFKSGQIDNYYIRDIVAPIYLTFSPHHLK